MPARACSSTLLLCLRFGLVDVCMLHAHTCDLLACFDDLFPFCSSRSLHIGMRMPASFCSVCFLFQYMYACSHARDLRAACWSCLHPPAVLLTRGHVCRSACMPFGSGLLSVGCRASASALRGRPPRALLDVKGLCPGRGEIRRSRSYYLLAMHDCPPLPVNNGSRRSLATLAARRWRCCSHAY